MLPNTVEMFSSRRISSCHDVDAARQVLSDTFLPVDMAPARLPGDIDIDIDIDIDMKLNALNLGDLTCGFMRFRSAVLIDTTEAENFHVDIPLHGTATMTSGPIGPLYADRHTAGVFMPGRSVKLACGEQFAQLSLMITPTRMRRQLENLLGRPLTHSLEFADELDMRSPGARMIMHAVRTIDEATKQEHGLLVHPMAIRQLEQTVIQSLLFGHLHNYSAELADPSPRAGERAVSRAVDLLRDDLAHPWTVTELATAVSLSARSLHEGFRRSVNATPMRYLCDLRLEKVNTALTTAAPGTLTVTEAATRWGFVHLGRFAASYTRKFQELPSDTLRRARD